VPQREPESTPPDASEIERLRRENEQLREDLRRSEAERQRLRRENEKLKDELEAARRAVYRQAAPFCPRRDGRDAARAGPEARGGVWGPGASSAPAADR
jgi:hypothetical protein